VNIKRTFISTFNGKSLQANGTGDDSPLLVAAYFQPTDCARWNVIVEAAKRVSLTVIVSPSLLNSTEQEWKDTLRILKDADVNVVGQISMSFGDYRNQKFTDKATQLMHGYPLDGLYMTDIPASETNSQPYWDEFCAYLNSLFKDIKPLLVCNFDKHGQTLAAIGNDVLVQYQDAVKTPEKRAWKNQTYNPNAVATDPMLAYTRLLARSFS
jgi:hypothetical protein